MNTLLLPLLCFAASPAPPEPLDAELSIELIAAEPEIVTPVGCRFDDRGRLLVIESHTHFPPDDYTGPETDRIRIVDDTDGDGRLDRVRTFHEGGQATMGIETSADGWIYLAQRDRLYRIRDTDGDDRADAEETLVRVDSTGDYPHNGLGDVLLFEDGWLYFGMGENLGEPYALIASDDSRQRGEGEGGNVFRCRPDGSRLERFATGFWNPFGLCFDDHRRLWAVGNDPDASPPSRLVHVVPGGDYGFQFRYGRGGTNPLQSWNGSLPGTLPMAAGTGEAPSGVMVVDDSLWVTSWGDNRIERYRLTPRGASWDAHLETLVQGGAEFRPVDMAIAPDGAIYVTDWVDRSYPVHGRGRIWRITRRSPATDGVPAPTESERHARALIDDAETTAEARVAALDDRDPFLWQAAVWGLMAHEQTAVLEANDRLGPRQRIGRLAIARWRELTGAAERDKPAAGELLEAALEDPDPQVRLYATRWIAESERRELLPQLERLLASEGTTPELFRVLVAAVTHLTEGSAPRGARDAGRETLLAEVARDSERPATIRAAAIEMLPSESDAIGASGLARLAEHEPEPIGRVALWLLAERGTDAAREALAALAENDRLDAERRADALAALAPLDDDHRRLAERLRDAGPAPVAEEARRMLRHAESLESEGRPAANALDAWMRRVGTGGDERAGRRVFFRTQCAGCHRLSGRGSNVGPDLTTIGGQMDRRRILESILDPAKEVGPMFVPWTILTVDGRVLTGMKLDRPGVGGALQFLAADGSRFDVPLAEIETQRPASTSIMPSDLVKTMSDDEIRDLLAFLARR